MVVKVEVKTLPSFTALAGVRVPAQTSALLPAQATHLTHGPGACPIAPRCPLASPAFVIIVSWTGRFHPQQTCRDAREMSILLQLRR
jgi:hypothetical protein